MNVGTMLPDWGNEVWIGMEFYIHYKMLLPILPLLSAVMTTTQIIDIFKTYHEENHYKHLCKFFHSPGDGT